MPQLTIPRPTPAAPPEATSHHGQTRVKGHPEAIATYHDNEDLWMPWKAYLPGHGNFEGWSALEAATAAVASINPEA